MTHKTVTLVPQFGVCGSDVLYNQNGYIQAILYILDYAPESEGKTKNRPISQMGSIG